MTAYRVPSIRRRRARDIEAVKHYVVHHLGKPVASSTDLMKARGHVQSKVNIGFVHTDTTWTTSGKYYVDHRWTGWEIREVAAL